MEIKMELDIWDGDWGLPSINVFCLQVMAYSKFSGAPMKTNVTNNPFWTPSGHLPVFRHGKKIVLTKFSDITTYLRQQNYSADFQLTPKQCAEVMAYAELLQEKLYPALQYLWWIDSKNYIELTRPWYSRALPLPLNYYYPGKFEQKAKQLIHSLLGDVDEASVVETALYKEAEECVTLLSTKLGDREFFIGTSPSSLDAIVFAYLAPLLKTPFPSAALQNHLKACNNLVRFVVRILQRYFPQTGIEYEAKRAKAETILKSNKTDEEFPHKRRNQVLAGLFAATAMVGYAFASGMVQVVDADTDDQLEDMKHNKYDSGKYDSYEDFIETEDDETHET